MVIMLDNYKIPEKGKVDLNVQASFEIKITAEEARRRVDHWLMEFVSTQMGADTPTLVIGGHPVWRVPAHISFPRAGKFDNVGVVNVDVATGEMLDLNGAEKAIKEYLEKEVKHRVLKYESNAA